MGAIIAFYFLFLQLRSNGVVTSDTTCMHLNEQAKVACRIQHATGKRVRHMQRLRNCAFTQTTQIVIREVSVRPGMFAPHTGAETDVQTSLCWVEEQYGTWLFSMTGPMHTYGSAYGELLTEFLPDLISPWLNQDGYLLVSSHVLGPTTKEGELIAHPPLHSHHFHFFHSSFLVKMEINTHGDSECAQEEQGVYCNVREYPTGVGFYLKPALGAWALFNDVRSQQGCLLESYVLAALRLHAHESVYVRPVIQTEVYIVPSAAPYNWLFSAPWPVNTSRESVIFRETTLHDVDYVLDSYVHVHREMVEDCWLLQGSALINGLLSQPWLTADSKFLSGEGIIGKLKYFLTSMGVVTLCKLSSTGNFDEKMNLDRRISCFFDMRGTQNVTLIGFLKRRNARLEDPFYFMHLDLRVYHTTLRNAKGRSYALERYKKTQSAPKSMAYVFLDQRKKDVRVSYWRSGLHPNHTWPAQDQYDGVDCSRTQLCI